jgi:hypothetical protein
MGGVAALALVASANSASAASPARNKTIHSGILVTNSSFGSGGAGGALLGYSAGQKNAEKPTISLLGNSTDLFNPAGVAVDLALGFEAVTSSGLGLANLVVFYQLGANGNTSPIGVLTNPTFDPPFPVPFPLDFDTGVTAQTNGQVWVSSLSPDLCATTSIADCGATSKDLCGSGTISLWTLSGPEVTEPDLVIGGCEVEGEEVDSSEIFGPIGLYVDSTESFLCADSTLIEGGSQGNCEDGQTQVSFDDPDEPSSYGRTTNRVWVVNSVGFVTIYLPDLAEDLADIDFFFFSETNTPFPPAPATNVFFAEAPLGGSFATTVDNLFPPPFGASTDLTSPTYIAVNATTTTAFISDKALGFRRKLTKNEFGRIKEFALTPTQTCLEPDDTVPTGCDFAITGAIAGSFSTSIEGRGTQLNAPQGIATFNLGTGDFVMTVNTGKNTVTEYAPGATGNAKPDAVLSSPGGKIGTLNLPVGLTTTPVP